LSLNEIEQLAAKAVRGAGNGWGVAEDIARAARWRAERGLGWSQPLLRLLRGGSVAAQLGPAFMVADVLSAAHPGDRWSVDGCAPAWVMALLSAALPGVRLSLDLGWDTGHVRLAADGGASAQAALAIGAADDGHSILVTAGPPAAALPYPLSADGRRDPIASADWHALGAYAIRTYVAASVQSRAGAGGGRVDDE
jgi:hypothetical protein